MKNINVAVFRNLINRAKGDVMFITPLLSLLIADKVGINIHWWYFPIGGVIFIGHMAWMYKRGIRQEVDFSFKQSKEFQQLKREVMEIKKILEDK